MTEYKYVDVDIRGRISLAKFGVKEGTYRVRAEGSSFYIEKVHVLTRQELAETLGREISDQEWEAMTWTGQ